MSVSFLLVIISCIAIVSYADIEKIDLSYYDHRLYGKPNEDAGKQLKEWMKSEKMDRSNPEEQGPYLEGDILVPNSDLRNGINSEFFRWPGGAVPFVIADGFSSKDLDTIYSAMKIYHSKTCIRFIRRRPSDADYISIENTNSGCWSSIGKIGNKQIVNFQSPGCLYKIGTVLHELMHAIGFVHEHTREDRDNAIYIYMENVKPGYENDFNKAPSGSTNNFGVSYDYGSVMHYSEYAFSKNGLVTVGARQRTNDVMGQREHFSEADLIKIKKMYRCPAHDQPSSVASSTSGDSAFPNLWGLVFPPPAH